MDPELFKKLQRRANASTIDAPTSPGATGGYLPSPAPTPQAGNRNKKISATTKRGGGGGGGAAYYKKEVSSLTDNNIYGDRKDSPDGNENDGSSSGSVVLLDDIALPTPPLGKPKELATDGLIDADLLSPPLGKPPSEEEEDEEEEDDGEDQIKSEFYTLVEKLVQQVMPSEADHIDELIEEYEGRETELLDTLTSMREGGGDDDDDDDEDDISTLESGSIISPKNRIPSTLPTLLPTTFDDDVSEFTVPNAPLTTGAGRIAGLDAAVAAAAEEGDGIERTNSAPVSEVSVPHDEEPQPGQRKNKKKDDPSTLDDEEKKNKRKRRFRAIVLCLICLLFIGLAVLLALLFTGDNNELSSDYYEEGYGDRDPPTKNGGSPVRPKGNNDGYDPSATPSPCNTMPPENIRELGVVKLQGSYPKVAIDGNQAIVSTGSGYVVFYTLSGASSGWTQNEIFEMKSDVTSVAISGNTAVVGAPDATTDLNTNLGTLETGAIYIYEKDVNNGRWRQLDGAYIPNEYKAARTTQFFEADFGFSVDIDDDVIVAGAPEDSNRSGSITVFHKDKKSGDWVQLRRVQPNALCGQEYFGYSVATYGDMVAASADCDVNIVLYQVKRFENGALQLALSQQMQFVAAMWGAVSSISMNWDNLVYSTVQGGLFFYNRQDLDTGSRFFLSQEMSFTIPNQGLYEYPLSIDANMLALAVENSVYIYTQNEYNREWSREKIGLNNNGEYAGYDGASLSLSDGTLLVASDKEVTSYDFADCVRESAAPTPEPSFSPTAVPTEDSNAPSCIYVNMVFDKYPQDTSWDVRQIGDNFPVAVSPAFDDSLRDYISQVCLPSNRNYVFTVYDVYSDGMCCDWGEGTYNVTDEEGYLIAQGGKFGESESKAFSMPFDPRNPFVETEKPTKKPTKQPSKESESNTTAEPKPSPTIPKPATPKPAQPADEGTTEPEPSPTKPNPPPTPTQPTAPIPAATTPSDCEDHTLDIAINLDQYPIDTRWEITPEGQSDEILFEDGPFDESLALSPVTKSICLEEGTYDFIIYDHPQYADGICCNWGEGSYELAFGDDIVASGGEFGASETKTFSTPSSTSTLPSLSMSESSSTSQPTAMSTPGIGILPDEIGIVQNEFSSEPASSDCEDHTLDISINLDQYPVDTRWEIVPTGQSEILFEEGPFDDSLTLSLVTESVCLPDGTYDFIIHDHPEYADGICCNWGEGSYILAFGDDIVASGGEFGANETITFSTPSSELI